MKNNRVFNFILLSLISIFSIAIFSPIFSSNKSNHTLQNSDQEFVQIYSNDSIDEYWRDRGTSGTDTLMPAETFYMGLDSEGSLWSWGDNTYGQLGTGNTEKVSIDNPIKIYDSTSGWVYGPFAGRTDGGIKDVQLGHFNSYILTNNGSFYVTGTNRDYRLGTGYENQDNILSPWMIVDGVTPEDEQFIDDFNWMLENDKNRGNTNNSWLQTDYQSLDPYHIHAEALNGNPLYSNRPIGFTNISSKKFNQNTYDYSHRNLPFGEINDFYLNTTFSQGTELKSTSEEVNLIFDDGTIFKSDNYIYTGTNIFDGLNNSFYGYKNLQNSIYFNENLFYIIDAQSDNFTFSLLNSFGSYDPSNIDVTLKIENLSDNSIKDYSTTYYGINEQGDKIYKINDELTSMNDYQILSVTFFDNISSTTLNEVTLNNYIFTTNKNTLTVQNYQVVEENTKERKIKINLYGVDMRDSDPNEVIFKLNGDIYYSNYIASESDPKNGTYCYEVYGLFTNTKYTELEVFGIASNTTLNVALSDFTNFNVNLKTHRKLYTIIISISIVFFVLSTLLLIWFAKNWNLKKLAKLEIYKQGNSKF